MKTINKTKAILTVLSLFLVGGGVQSFAAAPQSTDQISTIDFQNTMRKLWTDHVAWTRSYLVSASLNADDKAVVLNRLLQNQTDIGNAVKPFYGDAAGDQLTALLTTHIQIGGEIIANLIAGDTVKANVAAVNWQNNADDIATFLSNANPMNWPLSDMKAMMAEHLKTTTVEVQAQVAKDWAGSVAAYDQVEDTILKMADMLSNGIIKQFPDQFMQ